MKPAVTDWHAVAVAKLTNVMGPTVGRQLVAAVLQELNVSSLSSAAELRLFATALATRGGFASAVAALLTLHAAIHEGDERRSA